MTAGIDIVNIAQKQVGFYGGTTDANPYGVWYGIPNEPWCAMFVSWCFAQAGASHLVAAQTDKGFSYCPAGLTWFQKNGQVVDKYSGQPGDLVFFSWAGNGVADHVEIVQAASKDGITTIGGNTGPEHMTDASQYDGHGVYQRHRAYLYVLAIVRPNYDAGSKPVVSKTATKTAAAGVAGATALAGGGAAVVHNTTPAVTKSPTVLVAPPFPGTSAFKVGYKSQAVQIVERALEKAGLLPSNLATGTYSLEDQSLIPVYQSKFAALKKSKGLDAATYTSMIKEAGN
jgi:CHAP domain